MKNVWFNIKLLYTYTTFEEKFFLLLIPIMIFVISLSLFVASFTIFQSTIGQVGLFCINTVLHGFIVISLVIILLREARAKFKRAKYMLLYGNKPLPYSPWGDAYEKRRF